jgi:hypothetical protein
MDLQNLGYEEDLVENLQLEVHHWEQGTLTDVEDSVLVTFLSR